MKSHVFVLFAAIALLKVSLVLGEGEETAVVGAEPSPLNSTTTDSSASGPPSPKEAEGATPPQREGEFQITKRKDDYQERIDPETKKCVRILSKDEPEIDRKIEVCIAETAYCYHGTGCFEKCEADARRPFFRVCGFSDAAIAWIIAGSVIGVLILLAVAGVGLFYHRKKKQGVADPWGQLMQKLR